MDTAVKVHLLSGLLKNSSLPASKENDGRDLKRDLQLCNMMLENALSARDQLNDADWEFVYTTVKDIELSLNVNLAELLHAKTLADFLPEELFISSFPGCQSYDQVGNQPSFPIRGLKYMKDHKKMPCSQSLFVQRSMQVISHPQSLSHIALSDWIALPRHELDSEYLIINYFLPGSPFIHVVGIYLATPPAMAVIKALDSNNLPEGEGLPNEPWVSLLQSLYQSGESQEKTAFVDSRLKLVPVLVEAPWMLRMAVGHRPAITGTKIEQRYFRGRGYLEVDVDLSSSSVAAGIISTVRGLSKGLVVDLGWVMQGEKESELPEMLLCRSRFDHVDLQAAAEV